ncbi:MAG: MBL fold metallo-hydrolase [Aquificaceae bacterium]|nr:MBL fold metallo-hydrolase [Aquificaceae bacterium]MCS7278257.1 MBL fold metallo-hydrolase [Aquificaceae bacterium]MDW8066168.1 MBL fold metallo-hydrolase [Aquificaceae bacterium]MDW8423348.1 MBL fold metallo-hydrolase [Aquificaceae bacterium]
MSKLFLLLLLPLLSLSYPRHVKDTLREIAPGVYGVFGTYEQVSKENRGFISNSYFVITKEGVFVVDALSTYRLGKELVEAIRTKSKLPIRYVLITHYHTDHFYGLKALKDAGALVIAHPWSEDYLQSDAASRMYSARLELLGKKLMKGTKLIGPDITTSTSMTIKLGGETLEIHHLCKGHSDSDLVLWMPRRRILFAGDLVFGGRVPFLGSGHSRTWLQCLESIKELSPEILLPGHGEPIYGKEKILGQVRWTENYIRDIRMVVKELYQQGYSVEEVRNRANEEMLKINPEYAQLSVFFEVNPVNAYYLYFEIERELLEEQR